jgi:hypothetical protein
LAIGAIDEEEDDVGIAKGLECGGAHDVLQRNGGFEQSGGVDEDDLRVVEGQYAGDAIAGGLGPRARDGELLADEAVEQRGLPDVRLSDDGDETGASHWWDWRG